MRNGLIILIATLFIFRCGKARDTETVDKYFVKERAFEGNPECFPAFGNSLDGDVVFQIAEVMPEYKGGMSHYFEIIGSEIRIPEKESEWQTVVLAFVIDTLGDVRNACVVRSSRGPLTSVEEAALHAVKKYNDWTPGSNKGRKVPVRITFPLRIGHRQ